MSRTILVVSGLTTMSPFLNDVSGPPYQALTWHLKLAEVGQARIRGIFN